MQPESNIPQVPSQRVDATASAGFPVEGRPSGRHPETTLLHLENQSPLWFDVLAGGSIIAGVVLGTSIWTKRQAADGHPTTSTFGSKLMP